MFPPFRFTKITMTFVVHILLTYVAMCSEHGQEDFIMVDLPHAQEREAKENFRKKWTPPTHLVPPIECAYSPHGEIGTTFMLLAYAFQKKGPCIGYQANSKLNGYERALQDDVPADPQNPEYGALNYDVIRVIMGYLGRLSAKQAYQELHVNKINTWIPFEEHIGAPSISSPEKFNPISFYEILRKQQRLPFSTTEITQAQHTIIRMQLSDLQEMAIMERAYNPYACTMTREFINNSNNCLFCGKSDLIESEEEASWIEITIDSPVTIDIEKACKAPCQTTASCAVCKHTSLIWYTRKITHYPQLCMVMLLPQDQASRAKLPAKFTLGEASFKLCSSLGQTIYPDKTTPYIIFHDKAQAFWNGRYNNNCIEDSRDQPLAALYQLQETADGGSCLIS